MKWQWKMLKEKGKNMYAIKIKWKMMEIEKLKYTNMWPQPQPVHPPAVWQRIQKNPLPYHQTDYYSITFLDFLYVAQGTKETIKEI